MPDLQALEARFDALLPADRLRGPAPAALIRAAHEWSEAVWETATKARPLPLSDADLRAGTALAQRPVFICGAHRSGTTLIRDLLDHHPALSVLPAEGTYYTNLAPALARTPPSDWLRVTAAEWIRRLANPINRPPYWLLGRSTTDRSPSVEFARTLAAWWPAIEEGIGSTHPSWPLVAVAMAYATLSTGPLREARITRWGEKTPANERFLEQLEEEFTGATIVHLVRHPHAVLASRKQLEVDATGRFGQFQRALDDLAVSLRIAGSRGADRPGYCRIRYEDLLADPARETARLAQAIGIPWTSSLLTPTVAGRPASSNMADGVAHERGVILPARDRTAVLTARERARIEASVGDLARALGYQLEPVRRRLGLFSPRPPRRT